MSVALQFPRSSPRHELKPMTPGETLAAFHRGQDCLVSIEGPHGALCVSKDGKQKQEWKVLASLPPGEITSNAKLSEYLQEGQVYFSLSSLYASRTGNFTSSVTGLPCYSRDRNLRWLNCVSIDIDAHGQPFGFSNEIQNILDFTVKAGLPLPSVVCDSGRGAWLHWLLTDREDYNAKAGRPAHHPPGAYRNLQGLHSRILRAAVGLYSGLGAGKSDSSCTDSQRVARFPGSLNTSSGTRCEYFSVAGASDRFHTLHEMAGHFGVKALKTKLTMDTDANVSECTGQPDCKCGGLRWDRDTGKELKPVCLSIRARGGRARWQRPLSAIKQLAERRGQFKSGQRHKAVYLFAVFARRARLKDMQRQMFLFAAKYCTALSNSDVLKCLKAANKNTGKIRNATIVDWLKITDTELSQITGWLTLARTANVTRKSTIEARRVILQTELQSAGSCSIRKAMFLLVSAGIVCSQSAISRDLLSLRGKALKPKQTPLPKTQVKNQTKTKKIPTFLLICREGDLRQENLPTGTSKTKWELERELAGKKKGSPGCGFRADQGKGAGRARGRAGSGQRWQVNSDDQRFYARLEELERQKAVLLKRFAGNPAALQ